MKKTLDRRYDVDKDLDFFFAECLRPLVRRLSGNQIIQIYYQKDNSHRYATLILKDKSHLDVPICGLNKLEITVKIIKKIKEVYY
jgi:hypothetical protein